MFLAHLAQPNWLLSCKFECHQTTTVKLRSDLVHYRVDTSKKSFCRGFLSQNINSFHLKLPFLFRRTSEKQMGDYVVGLRIIGEVQ